MGFWAGVGTIKEGGKGSQLEGQVPRGTEARDTRGAQERGSHEVGEGTSGELSSGTVWWPLTAAFRGERGREVGFLP